MCFSCFKKNKIVLKSEYFTSIESDTATADNTSISESISSMEYFCRKNTFRRFKINDEGKLIELFCSDCQLDFLPIEIYSNIYLESLWLSNNFINEFDKKICKLNNLKTVFLSNNKFNSIPILSSSLINLYLDNNPIQNIKNIDIYTNLKKLDLNCCNINEISSEIGKLTSLTILNIHENNIKFISKEIGKLSNLQILSLHSNKITLLPKEIGNLINLNYLSLHFNNIIKLPEEIGNLTNLQRLSLHQNNINKLPISFSNLINIKALSLFRNNLDDMSILTNLKNCKKLALHQNNIQFIPSSIKNMIELEELFIYENKIDSLPNEINSLPCLKKIIINDPNIILENKNIIIL